jgi:hypothetical protein
LSIAPLHGEFELEIMIDVATEEMDGSDRVHPKDYKRALVMDLMFSPLERNGALL